MWGRLMRVMPGMPLVRTALSILTIFSLMYVFYLRHLGSLASGLSPQEAKSKIASHSISTILNNGLNAPYYLVQYLYRHAIHNQNLSLRLASVTFAIIFILCLYGLLKRWFGRSTAIFATIIFAATPWVVLLGRSAAPGIMFLWPLALAVSYYYWIRSHNHRNILWYFICVLIALSLYTPGIIWLLLAGVLTFYRQLPSIANGQKRQVIISGIILTIILLIPLIRAFVLDIHQLESWALIPNHWSKLMVIIKSLLWSVLALVWHANQHVDIIIRRTAILNVLEIVLCIFGIYALAARTRRTTTLLLGILLIAVVFAGLNQNLYILTLGLPTIAIFIAAGMRYLYIEWRRIFPLNPIAKAMALTMICLVVLMHLIFAWRYVLIAWPHTPETKATYVLK